MSSEKKEYQIACTSPKTTYMGGKFANPQDAIDAAKKHIEKYGGDVSQFTFEVTEIEDD